MRYIFVMLLLCLGGNSFSHQFTPTYPKFESSHIDNVLYTKMELFNQRADVQYYSLNVYDAEWNAIPFVTTNKTIFIKYLETKRIEVYIRSQDAKRVKYICTESLLTPDRNKQNTLLSSKICSKVK